MKQEFRTTQTKRSPLFTLGILLTLVFQSTLTTAALANEQGEVLTNAMVIELHSLGFSEEIIIEKIRNSASAFEVDIESLKALKAASVPDAVIAEMINAGSSEQSMDSDSNPNDPLSPHAPGIYIYQEEGDGGTMMQLEPSTYTQTKSGGFLKSALTYGAVKAKQKAVLAGEARLQITNSRPIFYFYFEETQTGLSNQNQGPYMTYTNPGQFILAEFNRKNGDRELVVATIGMYGNIKSGAIDKTVRHFDFEKLSPGIYKVTMKESLETGEYCFYYAGSATPVYGFWGGGNQVFDFGVRM